MSKAFTAPAGATWQTLLDELYVSFIERNMGWTRSALKNVQPFSYWAGKQKSLDINCTRFVDYVNGPYDEAGRNFIFFTLETWRAAADLIGFRRSVDGSSFSYGYMQAGDAIGPWIFEDLQKGISVLHYKKTRVIAEKETYAEVDPEWDLTPYQGDGVGIIDGVVGKTWNITGRGMAYGVQNTGDINEAGKLVELPATYIADLYYDGFVALEVWYYSPGTYYYK